MSNTAKEKDGKICKIERVAVKIIDARGIESLKIMRVMAKAVDVRSLVVSAINGGVNNPSLQGGVRGEPPLLTPLFRAELVGTCPISWL